MKIGCLGTGVWGFCLGSLLASNGHQVISWSIDTQLVTRLAKGEEHPFLTGYSAREGMKFTNHLLEAVQDADLIVEAVTSAGLRDVLTNLKALQSPKTPIVITSKGIEQGSGKILPEVALEVLGEEFRPLVGILSGPSFASEVIRGLPTSVVASAYNIDDVQLIAETFTNVTFRVYPNTDVKGVAFGGALKNIIAIACGISDGLGHERL